MSGVWTWPTPRSEVPQHRGKRHLLSAVRLGAYVALIVSAWPAAGPRPISRLLFGVAGVALFFAGVVAGRLGQKRRSYPVTLAGVAALAAASLLFAPAKDFTGTLIAMYFAVIASVEWLPLAVGPPVALVCFGSGVAAGWLGHANRLATVASGVGVLVFGLVQRQARQASVQQALLLREEQATSAAEARSAALAERARIAREIHDVLAHSLSAQIVHLEGARLLLERDGDREQVLERVRAAQRMAKRGLVETKQALSALREDLKPLPLTLAELAREHQAALTVAGEPRDLPAEVALAIARTAQEALTNVRKHAAGAAASLRVEYGSGWTELEVRNAPPAVADGQPPAGPEDALADSGSGYGLLGMRERAELLGGSLTARPDAGGFQVLLRVPA